VLILLLFFVAVAVGVVMLLRARSGVRVKHAVAAGQELSPLIAGTATDGQLRGTYQNMPVSASFVVETSGTDEMRSFDYYFFTGLTLNPGGSDWTIHFGGAGMLGTGHKAWHVASKDAELVARLNAAGAPAAAERSSVHATFMYRAKDGVLSSRLPGAHHKTWPDAALFANQLEVLAALAECERRATAAAPAATGS